MKLGITKMKNTVFAITLSLLSTMAFAGDESSQVSTEKAEVKSIAVVSIEDIDIEDTSTLGMIDEASFETPDSETN